MGAGFHRLNGVNPEVSVSIWQTYARPRLLYGLEGINLTKCDIHKLEVYQRTLLRQLLHLPERVATSAIYILSGQLPVEAEIHKRTLSLYGNIVRNDCIERELAHRQLAVKENTSRSWFVALQEILYMYKLPNAQVLLDTPPEKLAWKVEVRRLCDPRGAVDDSMHCCPRPRATVHRVIHSTEGLIVLTVAQKGMK